MYIKVRVQPASKKELFVQKGPDSFSVSVKERAERNMANGRVRELVAGHFKIPEGKVRLVSGHHSPSKIFSVDTDLV
jgi:uncharacterized protein YggU (UPF0235/DUF167 family)